MTHSLPCLRVREGLPLFFVFFRDPTAPVPRRGRSARSDALGSQRSGGNGEVGMSKPGDKAYTTRQNIHQACPKSLRPCTESHTLACTRMHKLEKRALTDAHSEAPIARLRSTQRSPPRTSRTPPSVGRAVDVDSRRDGAQSRRTSRKRPANAHRSTHSAATDHVRAGSAPIAHANAR